MEIDQCIFERNYGINTAFGSALSIDGLQGDQYESLWKTPIGKAAKLQALSANYDPDNSKYQREISYGLNKEYHKNTFAGQIKVKHSQFRNNYSGQKASAINLQALRTTRVEIFNTTFFNNTGSYSMFESEHLLPFYELLTAR